MHVRVVLTTIPFTCRPGSAGPEEKAEGDLYFRTPSSQCRRYRETHEPSTILPGVFLRVMEIKAGVQTPDITFQDTRAGFDASTLEPDQHTETHGRISQYSSVMTALLTQIMCVSTFIFILFAILVY